MAQGSKNPLEEAVDPETKAEIGAFSRRWHRRATMVALPLVVVALVAWLALYGGELWRLLR